MMNIKLDKFEGPLSLLLKLIEAEKMDITEISLVKIADEYLVFIKAMEKVNPEMIADFLVVAGKLLYIKSRTLLPYLFPIEEDETDDLEKQLKMYKEFLEAMKKVEEILHQRRFSYSPIGRNLRKMLGGNETFFSPPKKLKVDIFPNIMDNFIGSKKILIMEERTIEEVINIEETIDVLKKSLLQRIKISFNEFLIKAKSKTEIIVSFLAVLELMKQKDVSVDQVGLFQEIFISRKEPDLSS